MKIRTDPLVLPARLRACRLGLAFSRRRRHSPRPLPLATGPGRRGTRNGRPGGLEALQYKTRLPRRSLPSQAGAEDRKNCRFMFPFVCVSLAFMIEGIEEPRSRSLSETKAPVASARQNALRSAHARFERFPKLARERRRFTVSRCKAVPHHPQSLVPLASSRPGLDLSLGARPARVPVDYVLWSLRATRTVTRAPVGPFSHISRLVFKCQCAGPVPGGLCWSSSCQCASDNRPLRWPHLALASTS